MNFAIVHEVPGRIRVSVGGKIPESHACAVEERLLALPAVNTCVAYPKAGSLAVTFNRTEQDRQTVIDELKALDPSTFTKTDSRELFGSYSAFSASVFTTCQYGSCALCTADNAACPC